MNRKILAGVVALSFTLATITASADPKVAPVLPNVRAVPVPMIAAPDPMRGIPLANVVVPSSDTGFFAQVARELDKLPKPIMPKWQNMGPRDPAPRDRSRRYFATSLGIPHVRGVSGKGAAMAGLGAGIGGSILLLKRRGSKSPIGIGPLLFSGGGGIGVSTRW